MRPDGLAKTSTPESNWHRRADRWGLVLFAPALAVVVVLFLLPVAYEVWVSLHRGRVYEADNPFVGLDNYRALFAIGDFSSSLLTTVLWTVGSLIGQAVIGTLLAVILMQDLPGRNAIRLLLLSTWLMPGVVAGVIWRWMFDPIMGIFNATLVAIGLPAVDFLGRMDTALASCIVANIWRGVPFWLLMITARLQAVPSMLYDAAAVDGAGPWIRFRHVTLPQIRNIVLLCGLLSFIWTFNAFDLIYALTRGGPDLATTTTPMLIYELGFRNGYTGEAAAASLVFLGIMALAIVVFMRRALARQEDA